jgi:hypothetical protein
MKNFYTVGGAPIREIEGAITNRHWVFSREYFRGIFGWVVFPYLETDSETNIVYTFRESSEGLIPAKLRPIHAGNLAVVTYGENFDQGVALIAPEYGEMFGDLNLFVDPEDLTQILAFNEAGRHVGALAGTKKDPTEYLEDLEAVIAGIKQMSAEAEAEE